MQRILHCQLFKITTQKLLILAARYVRCSLCLELQQKVLHKRAEFFMANWPEQESQVMASLCHSFKTVSRELCLAKHSHVTFLVEEPCVCVRYFGYLTVSHSNRHLQYNTHTQWCPSFMLMLHDPPPRDFCLKIPVLNSAHVNRRKRVDAMYDPNP